MRRVLTILTLTILTLTLSVACGGGSATAPAEPPFPAVAGTYDLRGRWDQGLPGDTIIGTLTLNQVSRENAALTGTIAVTIVLAGQPATLQATAVDNASVTEGGILTFGLASQGTPFWTFTGSRSGTTFSGRHVFTSTSSSLTGPWTAVRIGG